MAEPGTGLQIDEDLSFQRKAWRFERGGWAALGLFLLAAGLGLFGSGPLATDVARSGDGLLEVTYPRFARRLSPVQLEARVSQAAIADGRVRLSVGAGYLAGVVLTGVLPSPESVEAGPERVVFTFRAAAGHAPVTVRFDFGSTRVAIPAEMSASPWSAASSRRDWTWNPSRSSVWPSGVPTPTVTIRIPRSAAACAAAIGSSLSVFSPSLNRTMIVAASAPGAAAEGGSVGSGERLL